MRKKILLLICFLGLFCFLSSSIVKASAVTSSSEIYVVGAQVRKYGKAGIRFVGTIGELDKSTVSKYGIVLAYGEVEISDDFVLGGVINEKDVLSAEVTTLTSKDQFFITLYDIPEEAYSQKVTARAYYITTNEEVVYSDSVVVRSLEYVVLAAYEAGDRSPFVVEVWTKIQENAHKHEFAEKWITDENNHWHECSCGEKADLGVHEWNEGSVITKPTFTSTGLLEKECTTCGLIKEEIIDQLVSVYQINVNLEDSTYVVDVEASGEYSLEEPTKIGYEFNGWVDENNEPFAAEGVINQNYDVYPTWVVAETKTIDELEERLNAGVNEILVASDITIDRTLYINHSVTIYSNEQVTLYRDADFAGDLFVVGEAADGYSNVLADGVVIVTLGNTDGTSDIIIDGNAENMNVDVVGSALFIINGAKVNMYDGVTICNHTKVGNERLANWTEYIGESDTIGGAGALIISGTLNMYGGLFENNAVTTEIIDSVTVSTYGGAIYNNGAFNMYGGTISECSANRGGAIYTKKVIYIYAGELLNNYAGNKGAAICTSESGVCELHIGSYDAKEDTVVFKGNTAKVQGGGILSYWCVPLVLYGGVTFEENQALTGVGAGISTAGPITAYNTKFINNTAYESGGAVYQYYYGEDTIPHELLFEDCVFEGNNAGRGGVMLVSAVADVTSYSTLNITNCTFTNNSSQIRVKESVDAETGEQVYTNLYGSGGVLYITKQTKLVVNDSTFTSNYADVNGGAIFVTGDATASITNATFTNNSSKNYGGVIEGSSAMSIVITTSDFINNGDSNGFTVQRGGVVHIDNSTLTTTSCNFEVNKASYGSAVYVSGSSTYTDSKSNFVENENDYGTVATYGTITLNSSVFESNKGCINGGAVYGGTNSVINVNKAKFINNSIELQESAEELKRHGGAIYGVNSQMIISGATFEGNGFILPANTANLKPYGGAIATATGTSLSIDKCTFNNNSASYGGAVSVYSYSNNTFTLTNSSFDGNSAKYGGAVYINGANATISAITALNNTSTNGGALYLSDCTTVVIDQSSSFTNNKATGNGGAIAFSNVIDATITSGTFSKNNGVNYGGAIHMTNSKVAVLSSTFDQNTTSGNGGAIYVNGCTDTLKLTTQESTFTNNSANGNGGAVYVTTSGIYIDGLSNDLTKGSTFTANDATNGGAIGLYGKVTLYGSVINENTATLGGAIWATGAAAVVTVNSAKLTANSSTTNGGAIAIVNKATLNDVSSVYTSNSVTTDGGAVYVEEGTIVLNGSAFDLNEAPNYGGAIAINTATATITNATFTNNESSVHGGAIHMTSSNVTIKGSTFDENTTTGNGGAIYVNGCSETLKLYTQECTFTNNVSTGNGGAVYVTGSGIYEDGLSTDTSKGSTFTSNNAKYGGAVGAYGIARLYGTAFTTNSSALGGAVWMKNAAANLTGVDLTFTNNTSTTNGGAVSFDTANGTIDNSEFIGNTVPSYGGAIHMIGSDVTITNSTFTKNSSTKHGGAIYVTSPVNGLYTVSCTFEENSSPTNCGAVYVTTSGIYVDGLSDDLTKGSIFIKNSGGNGGAIGLYGKVTLHGSTFEENTATIGGAIWATGSAATVTLNSAKFTDNVSSTNGGAIAIVNGAKLTDTSSVYTTNISNGNGGAIYVEAGGSVNVNKTVFTGNSNILAESAEEVYCYGGAIAGIGSTITIANASFDENTFVMPANTANLRTYGGAVGVSEGTSLTISNSEFNSNDGMYGGAIAIYAFSGNKFTLSGSSFDNNSSTKYGGALYLNTATVDVSGLNATNNSSATGGAIYFSDCTSVVIDENSSFISNKATSNGGAIAFSGAKDVKISNSEFISNNGNSYGGAIHMTKSNVVVDGSTFDKNTTSGNGGAIYVNGCTDALKLTTISSVFTNNTATGNGGAVYATGSGIYVDGISTDTSKGSTFTSNSGKNGGAIGTYGVVSLYGSIITQNTATTAGGAVTVFEAGSLTVKDAVMNNNTVTTSGNYTYMGGAISVAKSATATIDNVEFKNNDGGESGGAIGVYGASATVTIANSEFEGNTANNGGVIYIGGAGVATVETSTFKGNSATNLGAVVYTTSGSASTLNLNSAVIYNNNKDKSVSNGFIAINNALNVLNIYKANITYKDATNDSGLTITDEIWDNLIVNTKNGIVNEK